MAFCILLGLCHIRNPRLLIIVFLVRSSGTRKDRNGTHTTRDSCILYGWSGISSCIESFDFDCWWILLRILRCWSVLAAYTDCYEHGTTAWHAQNGTKATKLYLDAKLSAALEKSKILINIVCPPHMQLLVRCNYHVIYNTQQWVSFTDDPFLAQQHWQVHRGAQHKEDGGGGGRGKWVDDDPPLADMTCCGCGDCSADSIAAAARKQNESFAARDARACWLQIPSDWWRVSRLLLAEESGCQTHRPWPYPGAWPLQTGAMGSPR